MGVLRAVLSVLAVLIVLLTAIVAIGGFFLGSMQNNAQKSIDPRFIAYGLAGVAVIYLLSRRDVQTPSIVFACVWATPALLAILHFTIKTLSK